MTDIDKNELVGRKVFHLRGCEVFEILSIEPPMKEMEDDDEMLKLRSLADGKEMMANWVSEIGDELVLVAQDFPQEKIDKLHAYYRMKDEALMIEEEILGDEIPF